MASSSTSQPNDSNNTKNPTFQTVIDPRKLYIMIPFEYYESWKKELHMNTGASIRLDDKEAYVTLYLDDHRSCMFYGQVVAEKLGIEKPTGVLLEFKFPSRKFDVVALLPDVVTVTQNPRHEVVTVAQNREHEIVTVEPKPEHEVKTPEHMSDAELEESMEDDETEDDETEDDEIDNEEYYRLNEPLPGGLRIQEESTEDDEIDNEEYYRLYEPLPGGLGWIDDCYDLQYHVLEIWSKQVTISMANLKNEHKLIFSEGISDLIPGDVPTIRLIASDSDFEHDCKLVTTRIYKDNDHYVLRKHISGAWNLYRKRHGLKPRDMLHFKLVGPPFKLRVKIQRKRQQPLDD